MSRSKVFQVFPSDDEIKTNTDSGVEVIIKGKGKDRFLLFSKPVMLLELNSFEALKIAAALLGRIAICETCGTPYRRKSAVGIHAKTRFCSRECWRKGLKDNPDKNVSWFARGLAQMALVQFHPERLKDTANIIELDSPGELQQIIFSHDAAKNEKEATKILRAIANMVNYKPRAKFRRIRIYPYRKVKPYCKRKHISQRGTGTIDGPRIKALLETLSLIPRTLDLPNMEECCLL